MRNTARFMLLGAALISVVGLGAVETAQASTPSSITAPDPYHQGYREGYTQGMRDGRTDCRHGYAPRKHLRRAVPTQFASGWMTGYDRGFHRMCR
ncbi:hypothetical protein Pth03_63650 [Planotetraspora thailandica]|uniref:Lectin-like protein BA14k n=1 Tax=Planotetraspora thailandica TaxID=487172 RepID=A0A8J3VAE0_9ACTN|nr:hypothetical protein [Planotetraspora thailandica]GII57976.1 hypothetical protein Pth03_63650 [Planotetraspora thailandica]